jgi:uncharacterized protein (TIGR03905 family)
LADKIIHTFRPEGVCSRKIQVVVRDGVVDSVNIDGGCDGNLKAICRLVEGMRAEDAVKKLRGIRCGYKNTSCPDQLSKALTEALAKTRVSVNS